jgi:pyrimidine operon attenuation protein/uracil phosphoribosyltransferase
MSQIERPLIDPSEMDAVLLKLARGIAEGRRDGVQLRLVGVRSRGVPIAHRLAEILRNMLGEAVPVGAVDITLYRDDLGESARWPVLHGTDIPFTVDGVEIVLVDDVLFTGRTVRAALNAICDLGRPACIRLVVLVDRGYRELPVRADLVGLEVESLRSDRVRVRLKPLDPDDQVVLVRHDA